MALLQNRMRTEGVRVPGLDPVIRVRRAQNKQVALLDNWEVNNFVLVGDNGRTPAMRLGIAREPLEFEDIIWPGQQAPRPKRVRRRGRKAIAA